MNWFNAPTSIARSPEYIGSDITQRGTWFSLIMYCVDQENRGVIADSKDWKDRRWQQTCGVTAEEVFQECGLFWWDGDDLHVAFYPSAKEEQVAAGRRGGFKGGRPKKNPPENPTHNPCGNPSVTPPKTLPGTLGKPSPIPPPKPEEKIREEKVRENNEREGEYPPPLCTIQQARSAAPMNRMTEEEADHWWHTRNASGWTKGSTAAAARKITSWQSDMATSAPWVRESLSKQKQWPSSKNSQTDLLEWEK